MRATIVNEIRLEAPDRLMLEPMNDVYFATHMYT